MTPKKPSLSNITTGWASRTFSTARIAASLGGSALKSTLSKTLGNDTKDEDSAILAAEALVDRMDNLKGLMMKLGQMISYLDASMPPRAQRVLRKLQQGSKPLEYAVIAPAIERDLGADPETLFASFSKTPFAAASIGQVHKATLGDGREVAVKVQYPAISKTLDVDLSNLKKLLALSTLGTSMNGAALVAELRDRMIEECDYRQEASNQAWFRDYLQNHPNAMVPEPIFERSGDTTITSTFLQGQSFYDYAASVDQEARNRTGETIFDVTFGAIFTQSLFNGDPHPGNYLFLPDGTIAFLDFGCIKLFDIDFMETWKHLARTILEDRRRDFPEAMRRTGFVGKTRSFDFDYQWKVMQYLYTPFLQTNFQYTHDYVQQSYNLMIWDNPNKMKTVMPPDWLFINRLQWGLNSLLAHLNAQGSWDEIFRKHVYTPSVQPHRPTPHTFNTTQSP